MSIHGSMNRNKAANVAPRLIFFVIVLYFQLLANVKLNRHRVNGRGMSRFQYVKTSLDVEQETSMTQEG